MYPKLGIGTKSYQSPADPRIAETISEVDGSHGTQGEAAAFSNSCAAKVTENGKKKALCNGIRAPDDGACSNVRLGKAMGGE